MVERPEMSGASASGAVVAIALFQAITLIPSRLKWDDYWVRGFDSPLAPIYNRCSFTPLVMTRLLASPHPLPAFLLCRMFFLPL